MTQRLYSRLSDLPVALNDGEPASKGARQRLMALEQSLFELDQNVRQVRSLLGINPASWQYSIPQETEMPQFIGVLQRDMADTDAGGGGGDRAVLALTHIPNLEPGCAGLIATGLGKVLKPVREVRDRLRRNPWLAAGLTVCIALGAVALLSGAGRELIVGSAVAAGGPSGSPGGLTPAAKNVTSRSGKLEADALNAGKAAEIAIRVIVPGPVPQIAVLRIPTSSRLNAASSFVRLRGLPAEATLSQGVNQGPGEWILHKSQMRNLAVSLPPSWRGRLAIHAELINGSGLVISQSPLAVDLVPRIISH